MRSGIATSFEIYITSQTERNTFSFSFSKGSVIAFFIYIFFNEYNVLFPYVLGLGNRTLSNQVIRFFISTI